MSFQILFGRKPAGQRNLAGDIRPLLSGDYPR